LKIDVTYPTTAITDVSSLLTVVRQIAKRSPSAEVWFRGVQDANGQLVPSIGRKHWFAGRPKYFEPDDEARLLSQFRRFARQFEGRVLDEWEAIFLARHHGLPVRLMDWTANPLVALFMACEHEHESEPANGCIWALVPRAGRAAGLDILNGSARPLDVPGIRLIHPMMVSPRMNVQAGMFTIQDDVTTPLNQYGEVHEDDLDVAELIGYQVPGEQKAARLQELNDIGINRRTLFPDYDGLVKGLVADEILRAHADALT
jgi:hypothetical protein